jgi:hypothetical protein
LPSDINMNIFQSVWFYFCQFIRVKNRSVTLSVSANSDLMAPRTGWKERVQNSGIRMLWLGSGVLYCNCRRMCLDGVWVKVLHDIDRVCVSEGTACRRVVVGLPVMLAISEMWWAVAELLLMGCPPRGKYWFKLCTQRVHEVKQNFIIKIRRTNAVHILCVPEVPSFFT